MVVFFLEEKGRCQRSDCTPSVCVQVHTLEVFQKELNESEHLVFQAVHGLQRVLQGDYRDVVNMKESSRQRLEALREAAIKVCSCQSRGNTRGQERDLYVPHSGSLEN